MEYLNLQIIERGSLSNIAVESTIKDQIIDAQWKSKGIAHIKDKVRSGRSTCFKIDESDVLWFKDRLVVPKSPELRKQILDEAYSQDTPFKFYKVQWNQHTEDEATWESEDYLEENFPNFFASI